MYPWRHIAIKWTAIVFVQNCTNCLIKATTWVLHLQPLIRDAGATRCLCIFLSWGVHQADNCFPVLLGRAENKDQLRGIFRAETSEFAYSPGSSDFFFFFREPACHSTAYGVSLTQETITNMILWLFTCIYMQTLDICLSFICHIKHSYHLSADRRK